MSKFYVNQKVFDYSYGWGKIIKIITTSDSSEEPIIIFANNKDVYNIYDLEGRNVCLIDNIIKYRADKPTLATKEYYLEDFTQEPQINYTKYINKWGKFGFSEDKIEIIEEIFENKEIFLNLTRRFFWNSLWSKIYKYVFRLFSYKI